MKKNYSLLTALTTGIILAGLTGCGAASTGNVPSQVQEMQSETDSAGRPSGSDAQQIPSGSSAGSANSIVVNSSEKVTVVPDIAEVVYSVRTESREAADCQTQNDQSVSQVIELLKSLGIVEASIQTSDYYMNPIYNYSSNTARVTGYEAVTTLTVSDLPIDGLSEILSQSVATGINTIRSITYQASRYDESYQAALTKAVESSRQKAQALADAAGCNVGAVLNIRETSGYSSARYSDYSTAGRYNSSLKEAAVEDTAGIMPGEIQVEAAITVEYLIY